jgi:hypothetical protein
VLTRCHVVTIVVQEVGSSAWMEQHRHLEQLNIQAHQCAMSNSDDFVTEGILTYQKLAVIIEELIVIGTSTSLKRHINGHDLFI